MEKTVAVFQFYAKIVSFVRAYRKRRKTTYLRSKRTLSSNYIVSIYILRIYIYIYYNPGQLPSLRGRGIVVFRKSCGVEKSRKKRGVTLLVTYIVTLIATRITAERINLEGEERNDFNDLLYIPQRWLRLRILLWFLLGKNKRKKKKREKYARERALDIRIRLAKQLDDFIAATGAFCPLGCAPTGEPEAASRPQVSFSLFSPELPLLACTRTLPAMLINAVDLLFVIVHG